MADVGIPRRGSEVLVADSESGVAVVSLIGEHDIATVDEVRNAMRGLLQEGASVLVDLSETDFVESSIMHVLHDCMHQASQCGASLSFLSSTRPIVKRVFELVGAIEPLPVHQTRAQAIRALARPQVSQSDLQPAVDQRPLAQAAASIPDQDRSGRRSGALDLELSEFSDVDLLQRIAHGHSDDFIRLFERYAPTAMALAHRILRHHHLAEEAVQEAFLVVWRDPDRYRAQLGTVRSWLMATVHHKAVDLVRREETQRKRAADVIAGPIVGAPAEPRDVAVEELGVAEDRKAVQRALATLSAEQRQVIDLMYFGGLSQTRISERLSLPLGTVKSRTLLAMRHLRRALVGWEH